MYQHPDLNNTNHIWSDLVSAKLTTFGDRLLAYVTYTDEGLKFPIEQSLDWVGLYV